MSFRDIIEEKKEVIETTDDTPVDDTPVDDKTNNDDVSNKPTEEKSFKFKDIVKRDFSNILNKEEISQDMDYIKNSDGSIIQIKGVLNIREFSVINTTGIVVNDNTTCFTSLDFVPQIYDKLLVDDVSYSVMSYAKMGAYYKLNLVANAVITGKHRTDRI